MKSTVILLASLVIAVAGGTVAAATAPTGEQPKVAQPKAVQPKVVQQIVLIRHGIRAPTKPPEDLNPYSRDAWPQWPVKPGYLTEHGKDLMRALGAWHRSDLLAHGLTVGCDGVRVVADTDARNHDSAAAFVEGMVGQGCEQRYDAFPIGQHDPLFAGMGKADGADAGIRVGAAQLPHQALMELQRVLLGCDDAECLSRAKQDGKKPLLTQEPVKLIDNAGSFAENLMLEYVQGFPADQVGWGRADEAAIARLITVHNAEFALTKQPHSFAQRRDGNMVAHIAATFAHAAGAKSALPPLSSLAANGEPAIVLIGHDTDLATSASLLGVAWHDADAPDDYPPGGALIYQLVQTGAQQYSVRLRVAMPTLKGLRGSIQDSNGLRVATLKQPACGGVELCPLPKFLRHVRAVVSNAVIDANSGNEPAVTP